MFSCFLIFIFFFSSLFLIFLDLSFIFFHFFFFHFLSFSFSSLGAQNLIFFGPQCRYDFLGPSRRREGGGKVVPL